MKINITSMLKGCYLNIDGVQTQVELHVIPLGSYDMLIGMDWLGVHYAMVDC